jgi:hypothetical protein
MPTLHLTFTWCKNSKLGLGLSKEMRILLWDMMQRCISEELNPQLHLYKNIKTSIEMFETHNGKSL